MRVKVCGLTRPDDARVAVELGATDVGCVLVPDTPRCVDPEQARRMFEAALEGDAHTHCVLVFRNAETERTLDAARAAGTRDVQLHRTSEAVADELQAKGLRVRRVLDAAAHLDDLRLATERRPYVIDVGGGGSGQTFDWSRLAGLDLQHVFVAGGITPANVQALIPYAPGGIDLSSGVERQPGRKDPALLRQLFTALRAGTPTSA